MNQPPDRPPHILFLFSDTGGGHRSAAEAIIEALRSEFGDAISTEMVDFFKYYAPPPFNYAPELYPQMVKAPRLWWAAFYVSDGRPQARAITAALWPYVRRSTHALIRNHPADLYVSVHPLSNTFLLRALGSERPPFITVVTDLVTTHALWYDRRADLILLPTELARQRALAYGMAPERLRVVGQPIAARYTAPPGDKRALRRRLGWPEEGMIVLAVGGGEGMGPLGETARAIASAGLDVTLVIVTGRNRKLRAELEAREWPIPVLIYGFTRRMPEFMRAADVLVTKAGPGTIAEAMTAGLPLILYARLPGQEDGNVVYVLRKRAGIWAPKPERVVRALRHWIEHPQERLRVAKNSRRAARPEASRTIARILGARLGLIDEPKALMKVMPPEDTPAGL